MKWFTCWILLKQSFLGLLNTDSCTQNEHDNIRFKVMLGSQCGSFCQCTTLRTNEDGSVDYYWQKQTCPAGTLFNGIYGPHGICDHTHNVKCFGGMIPSYIYIKLLLFLFIADQILKVSLLFCSYKYTLCLCRII